MVKDSPDRHDHELETSSITDCDATTTPPPMGGGSQTGAQESPSTSDVEPEYDIVLVYWKAY